MPPKAYKVGIVGESNYQAAIRRVRIGEAAKVFHEVGNPYDDEALVVQNSMGETLGYIGRDHWLQQAVHQEGQGCSAVIAFVEKAAGGALGVVLDIVLAIGPIGRRVYVRRGR